VPFVLEQQAGRTLTIVAKAAVALDEGSVETDPPDGADTPRVIRWTDNRGKVVSKSDRVTIKPGAAGTWSVAVSIPQDAAIGVELSVGADA